MMSGLEVALRRVVGTQADLTKVSQFRMMTRKGCTASDVSTVGDDDGGRSWVDGSFAFPSPVDFASHSFGGAETDDERDRDARYELRGLDTDADPRIVGSSKSRSRPQTPSAPALRSSPAPLSDTDLPFLEDLPPAVTMDCEDFRKFSSTSFVTTVYGPSPTLTAACMRSPHSSSPSSMDAAEACSTSLGDMDVDDEDEDVGIFALDDASPTTGSQTKAVSADGGDDEDDGQERVSAPPQASGTRMSGWWSYMQG